MKEFIELFILIFLVALLVYEFLIFRKYKIKKKDKKKKQEKNNIPGNYPMEISILTNFYKMDIKNLNYNRLLNFVAVVSSIDIALIVTIAGIFENGIIEILVALVIVLPIIFGSYYLISLYYKLKNGGKKDE